MNPPNSLPSISEDAIIDLLNSAPQSIFSEKELIRHFDLYKRRELTDFADLLDDMIATNRIIYVQGKVGGFASLASARIIEGKIDFAQARKAFVVVDEEPNDIVVYPEDLMGSLHADKVRQQPRGQVVEVLDRARTEFTGLLQVMVNKAWVEPDMRRMHSEIKLTNVPQGFQSGHKVLVRVTDFGKGDRPRIMGELIESFGEAGTHKAQMQGIMVEFNLPLHYPDEPQKEAERIEAGITKEEVARRRDFRDVTTFTIDPIDAKDFDDALSIRKTEDGLWEVGVHIADVTHYVKEGTALEREAKQRATSVYLVDRVIPMLPERLSNELCSLRPHEDKLTYAAVFTMDDKAKVSNVWIGRTVIHSDRRFSYEQAQEILEGAVGDFKD